MINFKWHTFSNLTTHQIYDVLALRADIFIVEQCCPYLDADGKDKDALHLLGYEDNTLAAYLRLFPPSDSEQSIVFGRVVTARSARKKGYGKQLLQELITYCDSHFPNINITCSAQLYLTKFYESFGFKTYDDAYEEDGIPHIAMRKI